MDDVVTGSRWLMISDPVHPGGPARLVRNASIPGYRPTVWARSDPARPDIRKPEEAIVRAGDALLVEEHTTEADVVLHAVALAPAWAGQALMVQIVPGHSVVRAIAVSPGKARLAPSTGNKP